MLNILSRCLHTQGQNRAADHVSLTVRWAFPSQRWMSLVHCGFSSVIASFATSILERPRRFFTPSIHQLTIRMYTQSSEEPLLFSCSSSKAVVSRIPCSWGSACCSIKRKFRWSRVIACVERLSWGQLSPRLKINWNCSQGLTT